MATWGWLLALLNIVLKRPVYNEKDEDESTVPVTSSRVIKQAPLHGHFRVDALFQAFWIQHSACACAVILRSTIQNYDSIVFIIIVINYIITLYCRVSYHWDLPSLQSKWYWCFYPLQQNSLNEKFTTQPISSSEIRCWIFLHLLLTG
jgi:hypothetical protein